MSKYDRAITGTDIAGVPATVAVDVYDVLTAFGVQCPATAHAVKKLLCAGQRGGKDRLTDLNEAKLAIERAVELEERKLPEALR